MMKHMPMTMLVVIVVFACKKDEPIQPHVPTIQLSFEDASCTEVWLKVSLSDAGEPRTVAIQQDGERVAVSRLLSPDSVFVIEGLLPRHQYTFLAERLRDSTAIDASTAVQATTMDTTSHNFVFQIDTLGVTSSVLYDVAIINDTLAYAVGEMYLRDSTGQLDPLLYNLAKWNGHQWELKRVTVTFRGSQVTVPLEGIFAHSAMDIWLAGSIPIHGDGMNWVGYDIQTLVGVGATVSKIWGTQSEMCFVGRAGNIIHYASGTWQRVESGTMLDVQDVWGAMDPQTNSQIVLCIASNRLTNQGRRVIGIVNNASTTLPDSGLPWSVRSLWFESHKYYVAGDGLFVTNSLAAHAIWRSFHNGLTPYYSNVIRGQAVNDIVVGGSFGDLLHFNGASWRRYTGSGVPSLDGSYYGAAIRGNTIMAVGMVGSRAVVLRGTRP